MMTVKAYAAARGIRRGTVKRWVSEGLPVVRDWSFGPCAAVRILPELADDWATLRYPNTISRNRASVLYFARVDDRIKIGWTSDVERRMREIFKLTKCRPALLGTVPGDKPDELALHSRFAAHRIVGEWFAANDEILSYVEAVCSGSR
jgi:hypothetical protein